MNKHGIIEAVLFIVGKEGINGGELRKITSIDAQEFNTIITELKNKYASDENCPFTINCYNNYYYLLTKPELKSIIENLNIVKKTRNPISKALKEVLAIIAYNPDCTAGKIAEIRDVDPTASLDKLQNLGLIENNGRADTPGRPYIYNVTHKFYNLVGIKSFAALPKIDSSFEIDEDVDFFDTNRQGAKPFVPTSTKKSTKKILDNANKLAEGDKTVKTEADAIAPANEAKPEESSGALVKDNGREVTASDLKDFTKSNDEPELVAPDFGEEFDDKK